jgi:hypothetical protein
VPTLTMPLCESNSHSIRTGAPPASFPAPFPVRPQCVPTSPDAQSSKRNTLMTRAKRRTHHECARFIIANPLPNQRDSHSARGKQLLQNRSKSRLSLREPT